MPEKIKRVSKKRAVAILGAIRDLLKTRASRETKARQAAETIHRSGNYRWVGIYEIGAKEIAALAGVARKRQSILDSHLAEGCAAQLLIQARRCWSGT